MDANDNDPNKKEIKSESFKYKTSITGSTYDVDEKITNVEGNETDNLDYDANKLSIKEVEIVVPLKYLSKSCRTLDMPLIVIADCEITCMEKREATPAQGDNPQFLIIL